MPSVVTFGEIMLRRVRALARAVTKTPLFTRNLD